MTAQHSFSFEGGNELKYMGATWFITYAYSEIIDSAENRWLKVSTHQSRANKYNSTRKYHQAWYKEVLKMNDNNLIKNTLGVTPYEAKRMAKELMMKTQAK